MAGNEGFDLTAINAQLGQYHRVHEKALGKELREQLITETFMTRVRNIKDEYALPNVLIDEVTQAYQDEFTPKGTATFDALIIKTREIKIDYCLQNLGQLYESWLAEWFEEGRPIAQWSFPRFILSEMIIPQVAEDIETQMVWNGVYVAPTIGVAGPAIASVDGLSKIIVDQIGLGNIIPIPTGAITPANIKDRVEFFVDNIPLPYRRLSGVILMSETNARLYWRDYKAVNGGDTNYSGTNNFQIDGTRFTVVGVPSMEGSDRFLFTPKRNLLVIYDKDYLPRFRFQEFDRSIKILAEYRRGYGFGMLQFVFVNDQL